jgi:hypothetical protein
MPTRLLEEGHIKNSLAGSKAAATRDRIHAQIVRLYAKASEPRMERK